MTVTLNLARDVEERLQRQAERSGITLPDLVSNIVSQAAQELEADSPESGASAVAAWKADGAYGLWADRADIASGPEYARQLRQHAERRDWSE